MKSIAPPIIAALFLAAGACSDSTGPANDQGRVDLSIAVAQAGAGAFAAANQTLGGNTLVINRVQLVLREIELKRARGTADCSSVSGSRHHDDCEEFAVGPILVDLPLQGGTDRVLSVVVDTGTYRELEFEIHKPEDDGRDREFLLQHPDFARVSIRVDGTFNGTPFVFLSDLNVEQEFDLVPALVIVESAVTNLTLSVDLGEWFLNASGTTFVNPVTGNKSGSNEGLIKDNIKRSFAAFEDGDRDGHNSSRAP